MATRGVTLAVVAAVTAPTGGEAFVMLSATFTGPGVEAAGFSFLSSTRVKTERDGNKNRVLSVPLKTQNCPPFQTGPWGDHALKLLPGFQPHPHTNNLWGILFRVREFHVFHIAVVGRWLRRR